jgi:hypothetical protein
MIKLRERQFEEALAEEKVRTVTFKNSLAEKKVK